MAFLEADDNAPTLFASAFKERGIKTAIDTRHAWLNASVLEDACRGIDAGRSLATVWSDIAKIGVKKIQSSDLAG